MSYFCRCKSSLPISHGFLVYCYTAVDSKSRYELNKQRCRLRHSWTGFPRRWLHNKANSLYTIDCVQTFSLSLSILLTTTSFHVARCKLSISICLYLRIMDLVHILQRNSFVSLQKKFGMKPASHVIDPKHWLLRVCTRLRWARLRIFADNLYTVRGRVDNYKLRCWSLSLAIIKQERNVSLVSWQFTRNERTKIGSIRTHVRVAHSFACILRVDCRCWRTLTQFARLSYSTSRADV